MGISSVISILRIYFFHKVINLLTILVKGTRQATFSPRWTSLHPIFHNQRLRHKTKHIKEVNESYKIFKDC